jgi:hypothetical protein
MTRKLRERGYMLAKKKEAREGPRSDLFMNCELCRRESDYAPG